METNLPVLGERYRRTVFYHEDDGILKIHNSIWKCYYRREGVSFFSIENPKGNINTFSEGTSSIVLDTCFPIDTNPIPTFKQQITMIVWTKL